VFALLAGSVTAFPALEGEPDAEAGGGGALTVEPRLTGSVTTSARFAGAITVTSL
jgi:hypothetical protein